jgi:hypothetical protein
MEMMEMHKSRGLEFNSIYGVQVEFPKKKVGGTVKTCRRVGGFASGCMYLGTQPNLKFEAMASQMTTQKL